ncbi:MAG: hypothetical protein ACJ74J_23525 [Blastocatellia bacterium]
MQPIFCPICGMSLAATARFCGQCGNAVETEKPDVKPSGTEAVASKPVNNTQPVTEPIVREAAISTTNLKATSTERLDSPSQWSAAAMKRYGGAYRIARLTDMAGHLFKALAVLMALAALLVFGFGIKTDYMEKGFAAIVALLVAGVVFLVFFAVGLMVSAQALNLRANLDSAVHSSPFLTSEQKAGTMSL